MKNGRINNACQIAEKTKTTITIEMTANAELDFLDPHQATSADGIVELMRSGAMENASARIIILELVTTVFHAPHSEELSMEESHVIRIIISIQGDIHAIISPALLTHPHNGKTEIKMINGFVNAMLTTTGILKHQAASILPHVLPTLSLSTQKPMEPGDVLVTEITFGMIGDMLVKIPTAHQIQLLSSLKKVGLACVILTITKMRIKNVSIWLLAHQTLSQDSLTEKFSASAIRITIGILTKESVTIYPPVDPLPQQYSRTTMSGNVSARMTVTHQDLDANLSLSAQETPDSIPTLNNVSAFEMEIS